ncbi:glutamate-5-semialdehyde dehydrogenase [Sphingomonas sp. UYP23]
MTDATTLLATMTDRARGAARTLATLPTSVKARALLAAAQALRDAAPAILDANAEDMAKATAAGLSGALLDRLKLDPGRVAGMADGVAAVAGLADPVGAVIDESVRPNGLRLRRVRVPIGVIGIIYESRPNVTADAAALGVMAGNAVILRGGSEAIASNRAIHAALVAGLVAEGIPADAAQLVPTTDRAAVGAMLAADGSSGAAAIDLIVPRGGKGLVARVQAEARVPVLAHLDGINHIYVDGSADPVMAEAIVVDAKMRRTGVCGAMETLLIDQAYPRSGRAGRGACRRGVRSARRGCLARADPRAGARDRRRLGHRISRGCRFGRSD